MINRTGIANVESKDTDLLSRYRRGDDDAATALYVKYSKRLRAVARSNMSDDLKRRMDDEDVVQSVFRTFFRRATEGYFDAPDGDELWSLFLVIALNKIRRHGKYHRRQMRDVRTTQSIDGQVFETEDLTPLTLLELSIEELLKGLPPLKRRVVELRIVGHSVNKISQETDRCTRTVERILKQFRDMLSRQIHES